MFRIKQWIKMLLQNILLPLLYNFYRRRPVEKGLVLFADAHHTELPFSMRRMYEILRGQETGSLYQVHDSSADVPEANIADRCDSEAHNTENSGVCTSNSQNSGAENCRTSIKIEQYVTDFDSLSFGAMAKYLLLFMRRYAVAEYVFICDYFLPVASCRKRPETKVVQLWHSCGLTKKIAYDTGEDIPKGYRGNMFDNYAYLTMSAEVCVPVHERALRLSRDHIFATGISRTDYYFDEKWNRQCRENFLRRHPEAAGRKIALWAPTFRGNAAMPRLEGLDAVRHVAEKLKDEWYFIIKAHPHIDRLEMVANSPIPTEELLPVADVLITDYSSVLFDYLLYRRPVILFAPDLNEYESARGFYIDYQSIPYPHAGTEEELHAALTDMEKELQTDPTHTDGELRTALADTGEKVRDIQTGIPAGAEGVGAGHEMMKEKDRSVAAGPEPGQKAVQRNPEAKKNSRRGWYESHRDEIDRFRETYVGACDGHATERILELIGLS
ncbi:MAG: CDP-glycerol glycerophosphotransferase family protein [Clostridiales bacterium]|nr:CDP-glycerol glycerophosphotransferase family protein [Clostridiales bacterium]